MINIIRIIKKITKINSFWCNSSGSILVAFAIMVPVIIIFQGASINYSQTLRMRALISEASNEASLAVVALDNKNITPEDLSKNQKIALGYINYYVTKNIISPNNSSHIDIEYNTDKKEYYLSYNDEFSMIINSEHMREMGEPTTLVNRTDSYGNTRKVEIIDSTAVLFVSDFSGSATCQYSDTDCNDYTNSVSDSNRLSMMNKALTTIISKYVDEPQVHFSLIPYDIGVPIKSNKQNLAGGEGYECSVMYQLKAPYNDVDYNFWANKNINYTKWSNLKANGAISNYLDFSYTPRYANNIYYTLDSSYYTYYAKIIGPASGLNSNMDLVSSGLCNKIHAINSPNFGEYMYSCGSNNEDYPLTTNNKKIVKEQFGKVVQLYDYMFSDRQDYDTHYSFANTQTVDISGTISTLFSGIDSNTITFTRPIAPSLSEFSPFMGMCQSSLFNNSIMTDKMSKMKKSQIYKQSSDNIKSFKISPYLIPLTNSVEENKELLTAINDFDWRPGGGTDTMTALLRAIPVAVKGENNKKVIIILTDGKDDSGADTLRDNFLDAGVCQAITSGLTSKQNEIDHYVDKAAQSAVIHYIKIDPRTENLTSSTEYEQMYGKWYTKCVNGDTKYLHAATDYDSLLEIIDQILSETGVFIQKNSV